MVDAAWPFVSIVFVVYNRREELAVSLEQVLEHLDYPHDRLEVIVVDNASADGTAEMVRERFPAVQVIRNPENVGASAWNVGMTTARGDWRLILDDDCYIAGDALKVAVRRAEQHVADLVSFHVVSGEVPGYSFEVEYRTGLLTFWGCAAMFSRRVIENEPFYDPCIFIWANEMELTMRLLDHGYRHLYVPEVEAIHMKGPTSGFSEFNAGYNARHLAYVAAKHLQPRDALAAIANLIVHVIFKAYSVDRRALRSLSQVPRGVILGLRFRKPVRTEVSAIYRRHTWHYANQLALVRSPVERLRNPGDPERIDEARLALSARWYAQREKYYPSSTAVLEL
jgi:GT2 family glycosyltransferase